MTLGIFPDEKLLMYQTLKNRYFHLRDIYFTFEFHLKERKRRCAVQKVSQRIVGKNREQKSLNKIGFYIYSKNHLAHLEPIFRHLPKNHFEIVVSGSLPIPDYLCDKDYKVTTDLKILSAGKKFKTLVSLYMTAPPWALNIFSKGQDNQTASNSFFKALADENLRMVYSLGALPWNTSEVMAHYDSMFVYGNYEEQLYSKAFDNKISVFKVGYPKFDDYFNLPDRELSCKNLIKQELKTILWLPTKGQLSSLPKYWRAIARLCKDYNVILKPHPQEDHSLLEDIEATGIILVRDSDSASYYKIADFVFCDYGGSAFGALYTNTPFLFLSPDNPEQDTKNFCQESPEVGLREDFTTIQEPDHEYIKELLTNNSLWKLDAKKRKAKSKKFFEPNFGKAGEFAAMLLKNRLSQV